MRREEMKMLMNSNEYLQIIETIKGQIKGAQYQAALNVNRELIMLYYHIGKVINEHKTWGSKFIENLAADIRISFPNVKGYSVRNLKYMAKFIVISFQKTPAISSKPIDKPQARVYNIITTTHYCTYIIH